MKKQKTILQILFLANILGAGLPGSMMILAPGWAKTNMYPWPVDDFLFGITGSIWMAIGLVSLAGLKYPFQLAPLFLVQIIYKTIWIVSVGIPLGLAGFEEAWYYVGGFALVIVAFAAGFPFRTFFNPSVASPVIN